jgi:hypothetical protein
VVGEDRAITDIILVEPTRTFLEIGIAILAVRVFDSSARADSFPYFQAVDRNIFGDIKAQSDLVAQDLEDRNFEHMLEVVWASDHHGFLIFP